MKRRLYRLFVFALSCILLLALLVGCAGISSQQPTAVPENPVAETQQPATPEKAPVEAESATPTQEDPGPEMEPKPESDSNPSSRTITDALGNEVEIPVDVQRIAVTPIPWASVIYAIDGTPERLAAINPTALKGVYKGKFLEKLSPEYGKIDDTVIGTDFSINMEELLARDIQVAVIWDYQTDEAAQLQELGVAPVMLANANIEELQRSFRTIGQLLGKEERAEVYCDLYAEAYNYILSFADKVEKAEKPRILLLRDSKLKVQGNKSQGGRFMVETLRNAGADFVGADSDTLTMEEIIQLDPEMVILGNFDSFVPDDLYNNTIDGQDWSQVSAVKNHRVYKLPMGIYRWDAPGIETPLMMKWLAVMSQPEIFSDVNIKEETAQFMQDMFNYTVTQEDLDLIFQTEANANSVPVIQ